MNSKKISRDKKLYKRLVISHWDLSKARQFIKIVLDRNLHNYNNKEDEILFTAFSIAIIVTYWKPFSGNKSSSDVMPLLPNKCLNEFDKDELRLHNRIKKMRNSEFAHSDPDAHDIDVYVSKMNDENLFLPTGRNVYIPLENRDIFTLDKMIPKILKWISKEIQRIQDIKEIDKDF